MYVGQVREVIAPRVHGQSVALSLAEISVWSLAQPLRYQETSKG